ncbi:hypothetical protein [Methylorubrum populi]
MTQHPHSLDHTSLFDWPGEKPIERTISQFASDSIAGIASKYDTLAHFAVDTSRAGFEYTTPAGIRIRAGWTLRNLRNSKHRGKRPRVIEANFEPEGREFSLFARLDFSPYFDVHWDAQRSCHACSPTRVSLHGGGGDMEACHRWLMLWKLNR